MESRTRYRKDDQIGGRYLVHQALAGGMGEVCLCLDLETNLPYALKTFQSRFRTNLAARDLFKQEVSHWIALEKHPHIVRCFYMEVVDNQPFMFLEWVAGDEYHGADLRSWLHHEPLSLQLALQFALDLCSGLAYAAEKQPGIVHRDLKPDNVLIAQGDIAKITDWGLATLVARAELNLSEGEEDVAKSVAGTGPEWNHTGARPSLLLHKGAVGTPPYMAPEQWRGEELDARADLYAVGCILFEMLTGSWPYVATSTERFEEAHCTAAVPLLPASFPSAVRAVVARCLSKAREERYASAAELGAVLSGVYADVVGEAARVLAATEEFDATDYNNRGITYANLGQYKRAIADFEQALLRNPDLAEAYYNRGGAYDKLGQHERAIADFDQALLLDPDSAGAYNNRGNTYASLGQYEQAIADFDQVLLRSLDLAGAYYNRGNTYFKLGQHERAIADFDQALLLDPDSAGAYNNRGNTYASLGQYEQAIADFDQALLRSPDDAQAYRNRGNAYFKLGHHEQAISDYDQALLLDPDSAGAYFNRGNTYASLGQYDQAIEDYDQALLLSPDLAEAYNNRGVAYDKLGKYEQAIADFKQTLLRNPDLAEAYNNRGNAYFKLNQYERAIVDFEQALLHNPNYVETYSNRGNAYFKLGHHEQAIEDYDQALLLNPDDATTYVNKGVVLANTGRLTEALVCFEQAAQRGEAAGSHYAAQVRQVLGLPSVSHDPMQEAFTAFQQAATHTEMQVAATRFPQMTHPRFLAAIEQAIAEQVPLQDQPAWQQRLDWLWQITNEPSE